MSIRHQVALVFLAFAATHATAETSRIHVAPGKYNDYYHVRFVLTPGNCELSVPVSERFPRYSEDNAYTFSRGGQFEVFVRRKDFPVPAPHTDREFLILRMPRTSPDHTHAAEYIAKKRKLFEQIRKMKTDGTDNVEVIVELNPYITVLERDPLTVELSGRNIFFRQAHGQYIDHVGPLKESEAAERTPPRDVRNVPPEE